MTLHAQLGASSAHRWLACPGSVQAEKGITDKTSSFAYEGTCAHELAEICLNSVDDPHEWVGRTLIENKDWAVDSDMAGFVGEYVDYVKAQAKGADSVHIEQRVYYTDWVPDGFGTADAVIIKGDTIHVCDLKYGMGVQVDAENNPQGMLYALGAYSEFGFLSEINHVKISIVQPRIDHISEWSISVKDLLKWAEWVSQRAEIALSGDGEFSPGEKQCRFCKAKATCKALYKYTEDIILSEFDDLDDMESPDRMSDSDIRRALAAKSLIEGWLSAVETHVKERLESGDGFEGYKLVAGRSVRKWADEKDAELALSSLIGDAAYSKKLLTPAQAEKAVGKENKAALSDLIVKPAGKPTLAPESDKRPAISLGSDDFEDLS